MKTIFGTLLVCVSCFLAQAETLALWNFNSTTPDGSTTTGTNAPVLGSGTATLLGGVSGGFASGSGSSDPETVDDTSWSTGDYPGKNVGNKTSGVRFDVSTIGYSNIVVTWSQKNSGTASRYFRFQYTLDGLVFRDYEWFASLNQNFTNRTVDLSSIPGVANNSLFAFRIVSEFEYTVLNQGTQEYVATENASYGTTGTVRFDMVSVSGLPLPGSNTAPFITGLSSQTVRVGEISTAQNFMVLDAESPAVSLTLRGESSASEILPHQAVQFGGAGRDRTVRVSAGQAPGTVTITVYVRDPEGKESSTSFPLTILPGNLPPVISTPPPTNNVVGQAAGPVSFVIGDAETAAAGLTVSALTQAPELLPQNGITLGGSGSNRVVVLNPVPGVAGVAPVRVQVSDGTNLAQTAFALMLRPTADTLFYDPFEYGDGSLLTNSGFLWINRSGTDGQCQVTNRQLVLTGATGEDVTGRLAGEPYGLGSNAVLYASFRIEARGLPKLVPGMFAHFADGTTTRGRVLAGVTNAATGCYRLFIQNAGTAAVSVPVTKDLATNTQYRVVVRYALDTPATSLWVDPVSELDPAAMAADAATAGKVNYFGFRQDADFGATLLIDDLRVGLTWASVTGDVAQPNQPVLICERTAEGLVLRWTAPACVLQSASHPAGPYSDLGTATSPHQVTPEPGGRFFRLKR